MSLDSTRYGSIPSSDDINNLPINKKSSNNHDYHRGTLYDDIFILGPLSFVLSLTVGVSFYYFIDKWDISTSLYYATQVLLGEMLVIDCDLIVSLQHC